MALILGDRVKETSTTTGSGDYTLGGAETGFRTFSTVIGNTNTTYYCCTDGVDFEVGVGTYASSGNTLARTAILESSNSNSAVVWTSGTRSIFCTQPAEKAVSLNAGGNLDIAGDLDVDGTTNLDVVDIDGAVDMATTLTLAGNADFNGDLDVDGTTNLDAVDIDGAVQIDNTITVGANDQGYDVILYGDTASANMTWDTSADDLILNGAAGLVVPDGQLTLGSVALTFKDEDTLSSDSASSIASQQSIKAYVDAKVTAEDLDVTSDSGTIDIDLDSETLTIAGGEGIDTSATGTTVTIAGEDATTSNKGVASFSSDNFAVSSGAVTIKDGGVVTAELAADAVTGAKIADDAIDSEHYTDGSIDTAHLAADAVTGAKIADDAIDSEHYTDGSIDTAHLGALQVTTAKIAADAITGAKIADDAINSEHYTDGSIDTAHIADAQVTLAKIANQAANTVLVRDASSSGVVSAKAVTDTQILIGDGTGFTAAALSGDVTMTNAGVVTIANTSVETAMIAADAVTGAKIADDALDSEHYTDGSIDEAHLADDAVTADKLAANAVVNASVASGAAIADTKLAQLTTAGKVALTALEIDGGTDIGADLTTSDLIIVDDAGAGTNRKAALSRLITLMNAQGFSSEDPTALAIALG